MVTNRYKTVLLALILLGATDGWAKRQFPTREKHDRFPSRGAARDGSRGTCGAPSGGFE